MASPSAAADGGDACLSCGRSTRAGTRLFSDRRVTRSEDATLYLCGDCNERAISHYGRRLSDEDITKMSALPNSAAAAFGSRVHR
jgi:hypothetical protein